jgi:hypothetical protein
LRVAFLATPAHPAPRALNRRATFSRQETALLNTLNCAGIFSPGLYELLTAGRLSCYRGIGIPALQETTKRIEEASMKQQHNQSFDQKKGSADRDVTGSKKGMPGGDIGRGSMSSSSSSGRSSGNADYGGREGKSRESKNARNGSDAAES